MAKDFRASQIQTTQIISSGSSGTNAKIVVYPIESQDQSSLNQGIIDPASFNTSSIGTDIFFYVSGGIAERNLPRASISVFGGDLFVSGNLNISGNLSVAGSGAGGGASSLQEAYDGGSTIVLSASVPLAITSSGLNEYIFALLDGTNQSRIQARQIQMIDGSVTRPSYGFFADTNTGLYRPEADVLGVAAGSVEVVRFANTASNPQILANTGSVVLPVYSFVESSGSGIYRSATDTVGIAASGVEVAQFTAPTGADPQIYVPSGSTSWPSVAFTGDTNTGIYLPSVARIGLAFGGVNGFTFRSTQFWPNGGSTSLGRSTVDYWAEIWGASAEGATTSGPSLSAYDLTATGSNAGAYAIGIDSSLLGNVSSSVTDVMTALVQIDGAIAGVTGSSAAYTDNFVTGDWQITGTNQVYTISGSAHGLDTDNMQIQVYRSGSGGFTLVTPQETQVDSNFDVRFTISSGSAFTGQAILLKSGISSITVVDQFTDQGNLLSTTSSLQYGSNVSASNQLTFATTTTTGSETVAAMILPLSGNRIYDMDFTILAAGTGSGITKRFKRNIAAYDYGTPTIIGDVAYAVVPDVSGSSAAATADVDFAISASNVVCYVSGVVSESISWTVNAFITKGEN